VRLLASTFVFLKDNFLSKRSWTAGGQIVLFSISPGHDTTVVHHLKKIHCLHGSMLLLLLQVRRHCRLQQSLIILTVGATVYSLLSTPQNIAQTTIAVIIK